MTDSSNSFLTFNGSSFTVLPTMKDYINTNRFGLCSTTAINIVESLGDDNCITGVKQVGFAISRLLRLVDDLMMNTEAIQQVMSITDCLEHVIKLAVKHIALREKSILVNTLSYNDQITYMTVSEALYDAMRAVKLSMKKYTSDDDARIKALDTLIDITSIVFYRKGLMTTKYQFDRVVTFMEFEPLAIPTSPKEISSAYTRITKLEAIINIFEKTTLKSIYDIILEQANSANKADILSAKHEAFRVGLAQVSDSVLEFCNQVKLELSKCDVPNVNFERLFALAAFQLVMRSNLAQLNDKIQTMTGNFDELNSNVKDTLKLIIDTEQLLAIVLQLDESTLQKAWTQLTSSANIKDKWLEQTASAINLVFTSPLSLYRIVSKEEYKDKFNIIPIYSDDKDFYSYLGTLVERPIKANDAAYTQVLRQIPSYMYYSGIVKNPRDLKDCPIIETDIEEASNDMAELIDALYKNKANAVRDYFFQDIKAIAPYKSDVLFIALRNITMTEFNLLCSCYETKKIIDMLLWIPRLIVDFFELKNLYINTIPTGSDRNDYMQFLVYSVKENLHPAVAYKLGECYLPEKSVHTNKLVTVQMHLNIIGEAHTCTRPLYIHTYTLGTKARQFSTDRLIELSDNTTQIPERLKYKIKMAMPMDGFDEPITATLVNKFYKLYNILTSPKKKTITHFNPYIRYLDNEIAYYIGLQGILTAMFLSIQSKLEVASVLVPANPVRRLTLDNEKAAVLADRYSFSISNGDYSLRYLMEAALRHAEDYVQLGVVVPSNTHGFSVSPSTLNFSYQESQDFLNLLANLTDPSEPLEAKVMHHNIKNISLKDDLTIRNVCWRNGQFIDWLLNNKELKFRSLVDQLFNEYDRKAHVGLNIQTKFYSVIEQDPTGNAQYLANNFLLQCILTDLIGISIMHEAYIGLLSKNDIDTRQKIVSKYSCLMTALRGIDYPLNQELLRRQHARQDEASTLFKFTSNADYEYTEQRNVTTTQMILLDQLVSRLIGSASDVYSTEFRMKDYRTASVTEHTEATLDAREDISAAVGEC